MIYDFVKCYFVIPKNSISVFGRSLIEQRRRKNKIFDTWRYFRLNITLNRINTSISRQIKWKISTIHLKWYDLDFIEILTSCLPHILTFSLRFITIHCDFFIKLYEILLHKYLSLLLLCYDNTSFQIFELFEFQANLNHQRILMTNRLNCDRRTHHRLS